MRARLPSKEDVVYFFLGEERRQIDHERIDREYAGLRTGSGAQSVS